MDMSDRENVSADDAATAPDLLQTAAQCAASDLLDFAAQLAGLAEDLKALAAKPIGTFSEPIEPDGQPEASRIETIQPSSPGDEATRHPPD
ncbi:hypothetical protein GOE20_14620 [Sinorhizobium medicae]|nr:hypothetical protein [Sinorhizobium medicae]